MSQPLGARDKMRAKDPKIRSSFKPLVSSGSNAIESTEFFDANSTAADFIPAMIYDTMYVSLRNVVFQVDGKSYVPIAIIIYKKFGGRTGGGNGIGKLCGLINGVCPPIMTDKIGDPEAWFSQSEEVKLEWAPYAKMRKTIEDARKIYRIGLREANMRDIDIAYSGPEATIEIFKSDRSRIESAGGKVYHLWPLNQVERTLRMSALIKSDILDRLFPPERLQSGCIEISTNTPAAQDNTPSALEDKGTMFLYRMPQSGMIDSHEVKKEIRKERMDEDVAEVHGMSDFSCRLQAVKGKDKRPWRIWPSSHRPGWEASLWSRDTAPFTQDPGLSSDEWYRGDLAIRHALIHEWEEATRYETLGVDGEPKFVRCTSFKAPQESVPGVDYPLVPELCVTYVADQNPGWYEEHIRKLQAMENLAELKMTQQKYQDRLVNTKRTGKILADNVQLSKQEIYRYDPVFQRKVWFMMRIRVRLDRELEHMKTRLMELYKMVKSFATGLIKRLHEREQVQPEGPSSFEAELSYCSSEEETSTEHNAGVTFTTPDNTTHPEQQANISNQVADQYGTETFQDRMVEKGVSDQVAERAEKDKMIEKYKKEARVRKATGRSITNILADTGIRVEHRPSMDVSHHEAVVESSFANPVTPSDWLSLPSTIRDMEDAELPIAQSGTLNSSSGVKVEDESRAAPLRFGLPPIAEEDEFDTGNPV